MLAVIVSLSLLAASGKAAVDEDVTCRIRVPEKYGRQCGFCPSGVPEAEQYYHSYKAAWWRCIATKGKSLDAECRAGCSRSEGAMDGCADADRDAEQQITRLRKKLGDGPALRHLRMRIKKDTTDPTGQGLDIVGPCERLE